MIPTDTKQGGLALMYSPGSFFPPLPFTGHRGETAVLYGYAAKVPYGAVGTRHPAPVFLFAYDTYYYTGHVPHYASGLSQLKPLLSLRYRAQVAGSSLIKGAET